MLWSAPPSGGRGRVRKPASTRVHVDEVVWCILETVLWSLDDAAFGRMRSRSSTILAPSDKVARSSGVRSS